MTNKASIHLTGLGREALSPNFHFCPLIYYFHFVRISSFNLFLGPQKSLGKTIIYALVETRDSVSTLNPPKKEKKRNFLLGKGSLICVICETLGLRVFLSHRKSWIFSGLHLLITDLTLDYVMFLSYTNSLLFFPSLV